MKPIIIAIDGFSSTGKSTLAKELAKKLHYIYVDTGAMYRAVTFFAMQNDMIKDSKLDTNSLTNALQNVHLSFVWNDEKQLAEMNLNGQNIENEIRTLEVSQNVSQVASLSAVRSKLVEQQQEMGKNKGLVMDGRDIGTVVFPEAEVKLFMTASATIRAKRRFDELTAIGDLVSFEAIYKNVTERDYVDSNREDSPLRKASDAIEIDNSHLSKEEQLEKVLQIIQEKINP
uniref:(d)CMP kinase n=1 Tax=Flavobacterium sp. TaxID=239 RepID=UPI0040497440